MVSDSTYIGDNAQGDMVLEVSTHPVLSWTITIAADVTSSLCSPTGLRPVFIRSLQVNSC